jgi:anti-sigma B factor antagonist
MSMEITERVVGDVVVLDVSGKMLLGEGDVQLRETIQKQIEAGNRKLVLNLAGVPYVDSAGLGEMVRCYTTVARDGGTLRLVNATKRIKDLLTITKLITVFDHYDSEEEAINSLQ